MRTTLATLSLLFLLSLLSLGQEPTPALHSKLDTLLKTFVKDGVVDYSGLKKKEADLDAYLAVLDKTDPSKLSEPEQIAFYINAYNAFTLKLILDHWPVESIKDIPDHIFNRSRWKAERWKINGEEVSLDHIEHGILRKKFNEPRIHFALVCAAKSCPNLASTAYTGESLDKQLTAAGHLFLSDTKKGLRVAGDEIHISEIFSWFAEDFEAASGTVFDFIKEHAPEAVQKQLAALDDPDIEYLDYDWSLNGK